MNADLNHATRRLLQVVLDMLSNPDFDRLMAEREADRTDGKSTAYLPTRYRCDPLAVEAAHRAAKEAQEMLAEAAGDGRAPVERPTP